MGGGGGVDDTGVKGSGVMITQLHWACRLSLYTVNIKASSLIHHK